jgi:hypothetical protein
LDGNLVVCSHQIDLGEEGTTKKLVGIVVDMLDGIAVRNGLAFEARELGEEAVD